MIWTASRSSGTWRDHSYVLTRAMRHSPSKPKSAAELMLQLQDDPEFVRNNAERMARQEALAGQLRIQEEPLLRELAGIGVVVESVWDLVNTAADYSPAIPILGRHLQQPYHQRIVEGIARALTTKKAQGLAGSAILQKLKQADEPSPETRWALANALVVVADASLASEILIITEDKRFADIRHMLLLVLQGLRAGNQQAQPQSRARRRGGDGG